jgi:hypothetical protein
MGADAPHRQRDRLVQRGREVAASSAAGLAVAILLASTACDDGGHGHSATEADAHGHGDAASHASLTWEQVALGCSTMGSGSTAHVMCNHGHSFNLRNESLYVRRLYLQDHGHADPNETELMHGHHGLPPPLTPTLRARLGERTRLRVVSYGPQFHTFHLHGHLWLDGGKPIDTKVLGPAEVHEAEFYAGAGATDAGERGGPGSWMYHCHVEGHAVTGMWGNFEVLPKDASATVDASGRFAHEVPPPLGGPGQTVDVWVVAAEVPLVIARDYDAGAKQLIAVERMARVYVPMANEAALQQATAASVRQQLATQKESWTPWVLALRQGTQVRIHLRNLMATAPATLHPHGVAFTTEGDGTHPDSVAKVGGPAVSAQWLADTPGTWPLHDHAKAVENLGRGLFAAIVVLSPQEEATLQRDYVLFMHDYDMDWAMGAAAPMGAGH